MSDRLRRPGIRSAGRRRSPGQALVEFSLALIPFMLLLMGVLDLGRGIYAMNATSEAAREIARATSVHRCADTDGGCADLGTSIETQAAIATQRTLIPNLVFDPSVDIDCVDATDSVISDIECTPSSDTDRYIRVHVRSTFSPVTPLLGIFGNHVFESWSRIRLS
jgi:Flp pilus assembly protein TadG